MLGSAVLLVLAAALLLGTPLAAPHGRRRRRSSSSRPGRSRRAPGLLFETESAYQYIQIVERSDGSRALKLNEGVAVHSVWHEDSVLTGGVWDTFLLVPPLLDRPVERMLVIGNAGGTVARAYGELYPDVEIDGVEIDPEVSEAARRYMGLERQPAPERDHRRTGGRSSSSPTRRYDVIVVDAYHQPYIPFYLATREFFAAVREHLRPGGVVALNVAGVPGDERLSEAIGSTLLAEFPQAWRWRPLRFNELMLGFDRPRSAGRSSSSAWRPRRRRSARSSRSSRPGLEPVRGRRAAAHGRPRAGRVADRPDDRRLRRRAAATSTRTTCRRARSAPGRERAEERARGEELQPRRAAPPALCQPRTRWLGKSLRPPGPRQREDVLDVGHRRRRRRPTTAGSSGPRVAARSASPAKPLSVSNRREATS